MKRSLILLSCVPMLMRAPGGEKETSDTAGGVTSTKAVTLGSTFAESHSISTDPGVAYDPAADAKLVPIAGNDDKTIYVSPESAEHILAKRTGTAPAAPAAPPTPASAEPAATTTASEPADDTKPNKSKPGTSK